MGFLLSPLSLEVFRSEILSLFETLERVEFAKFSTPDLNLLKVKKMTADDVE